MSESRSLFGDYLEKVDIWARIQAFDQLFMIPTLQFYQFTLILRPSPLKI